MALVDLVHIYNDHVAGQLAPCRDVALTIPLPGAEAYNAGLEIQAKDVRWPWFTNGDQVRCGSCNGYAGECLNADCARAHVCVPVKWPSGRLGCRAGCDQ